MLLNKLKIAIVEKNTEAINKLLDDIPKLENKKEMKEAMYLLKEAGELLHTLKDATAESMKQVKKNIDFLKSTQPPISSKLNIRS